MFREMRRKGQELTTEDTLDILETGTCGVLALDGDDGYPYALPISYAYCDSTLYFHSATTGHKIDAIKRCDKASFCVIDQDKVVPEELTTYFRSAIAFGRIRVIEDEAGKREGLRKLAEKYLPDRDDLHVPEIEKQLSRTVILALDVEHLTGKEARELAKQR